MEISRDLINPSQAAPQNRGEAERLSAERRYNNEQQSAQNRTAQAGRRSATASVDRVDDKGSVDYTDMVQQARVSLARDDYRRVTPSATEPLGTQRALNAYRDNGNTSLEESGIELLPRVDSYV